MTRYELCDSQRGKIEGSLTGRADTVGVTAKDNRTFVNGVLWILRSGAHWKDMPEKYGNWKNAHKRFTRRAEAGVWERIFKVLVADPKNTGS